MMCWTSPLTAARSSLIACATDGARVLATPIPHVDPEALDRPTPFLPDFTRDPPRCEVARGLRHVWAASCHSLLNPAKGLAHAVNANRLGIKKSRPATNGRPACLLCH